MTRRLPALTARDVVRALQRFGFERQHQTGSHLILRHPQSGRKVAVPIHRGSLKRGTLFGILRDAGVSQDELRKLL